MSKTIGDMRDDLRHIVLSAQDILDKAKTENRSLTAEEQQSADKLIAESDTLEAAIIDREKQDELRKSVSSKLDHLNESRGRQTEPSQPVNENHPYVPARPKHGGLKAFRGHNAEERAYRAGQWIMGVLFNNEHSKRWLQNHGMEYRAQSTFNQAYGGTLVPEELSSTIIDLREQYGVFRKYADIYPMSGDTATIPRANGGLTATYTDEAGALTETTQAWDNVKLTARKLGILNKMSTEIAEDAVINLADWIAMKSAEAFAKAEDDAGFKGDGTTTYGTITGLEVKIIDGNHAAGAVDITSGHDELTDVDATDIGLAMGAIPEYAAPNAKFYCNRIANALVFQRLTSAAGGQTMQMMEDGKWVRSYLGHEIVVTQSMTAATGAAAMNDKVIFLFGDLSLAATMGTRREIAMKVLNELYAANDQVGITVTSRYDINVHDLGDGTTAGPIAAAVGVT